MCIFVISHTWIAECYWYFVQWPFTIKACCMSGLHSLVQTGYIEPLLHFTFVRNPHWPQVMQGWCFCQSLFYFNHCRLPFPKQQNNNFGYTKIRGTPCTTDGKRTKSSTWMAKCLWKNCQCCMHMCKNNMNFTVFTCSNRECTHISQPPNHGNVSYKLEKAVSYFQFNAHLCLRSYGRTEWGVTLELIDHSCSD